MFVLFEKILKPIFERMASLQLQTFVTEQKIIFSTYLEREVRVDFYYPAVPGSLKLSLLLINDGQDLPKMDFANMLDGLMASGQITKIMAVGIHAGDRLSEYGTAHIPDYKNRGEKSFSYQRFVLEELIPFINHTYQAFKFTSKAMTGFSLGALSALDIAWSYPRVFSIAGMFSGSFWWRTKDLNDGYDENADRIMHSKIRNGSYHRGLRFYFTTGAFDETEDRNKNGVIDSIDDTVDLISELEELGYKKIRDIRYINYEDGKHDVETWGKAMPAFLIWGWRKK